MSDDAADRSASMERLSALMDGELAEPSVLQACARWREDASLRSSWHAYLLIGDVLRSEDLASSAKRDACFLTTLRARLADEPVVLAPIALAGEQMASGIAQNIAGRRATRRARWSWSAASAVAAGFVAVAGVVTITRTPGTPAGEASAARLALRSAAPQPEMALAQEPELLVANGQLIRDARLDRYLAAHKQFAGSSALGVPSAFLRSATLDASNR